VDFILAALGDASHEAQTVARPPSAAAP
jgi:hypothetical protein